MTLTACPLITALTTAVAHIAKIADANNLPLARWRRPPFDADRATAPEMSPTPAATMWIGNSTGTVQFLLSIRVVDVDGLRLVPEPSRPAQDESHADGSLPLTAIQRAARRTGRSVSRGVRAAM